MLFLLIQSRRSKSKASRARPVDVRAMAMQSRHNESVYGRCCCFGVSSNGFRARASPENGLLPSGQMHRALRRVQRTQRLLRRHGGVGVVDAADDVAGAHGESNTKTSAAGQRFERGPDTQPHTIGSLPVGARLRAMLSFFRGPKPKIKSEVLHPQPSTPQAMKPLGGEWSFASRERSGSQRVSAPSDRCAGAAVRVRR